MDVNKLMEKFNNFDNTNLRDEQTKFIVDILNQSQDLISLMIEVSPTECYQEYMKRETMKLVKKYKDSNKSD